jgi:5-methylcytosine rRNA methyltransferase NSUN4
MGSSLSGAQRFDTYYRELYRDRWDGLRDALLKDAEPCPFSYGLLKAYYLDQGSVLAASLLPVRDGDCVLDMCAAPGGKSLVIASKLAGSGSLLCNDRSSQRRARLKKVLDEHLPTEWRSTVSISSHDATRWGLHQQEEYDAILLDAPCSSERHVLKDPTALAEWGPARAKHLAVQQFAMLAAALEAVKKGGTILYSTCAISQVENEGVISKLHLKRGGRFEEIPVSVPGAEPLEHGQIILPDTNGGRGPMYFFLLRRLS